MNPEKSFHSICRWTFNAGKGGFVPSRIRPKWDGDQLDTAGVVRLIREKIAPRLPGHVVLGYEVHYDSEVNEDSADEVADALEAAGIHLAMITPGAHSRFAYGGIASLDPAERSEAEAFGERTLDLAYGPLKKAWHPDPPKAPSFVIWNGSFGYDLASIGLWNMYQNLKESVAKLCKADAARGGELYLSIEPKPNEGHPALMLPTVASAIAFWRRLHAEYDIPLERKGVNKEFGHSEMIGLDHVYDTVEEIDNQMLMHMHLNSQGYNDGIILGGPGKYDIDHGTRINGMNIAIAGLLGRAGIKRWMGHDMQPRAYDNEEQALDRVVRSILSWEACENAARGMDGERLMQHLADRDTAKAEDLIRNAVVRAQQWFNETYEPL
jgi:xylose isomerase